MADTECIARLGGLEGYEYVESWEEQRGKARWCVVRLRPIAGIARTCSGCGASTVAIHDSEEHCRWPLGTNIVEGINNTIKVIKRMAYGYRDDVYFFLRIRAAFPGIR